MGCFNARPVVISKITGKSYQDTKEGWAQMDMDEGRVRVPNSVMEAIVTLIACVKVAMKAVVTILPFIKKTGAGKMLKAQIAGMHKSLSDILRKVSVKQNRTLENNTQLVTITVSSGKLPAMINIDVDDMECICNRALEMCAFSCGCTREESKECRLRQAFEQVASASVEAVHEDPTKCPYAGRSIDLDFPMEGGE